MIKKTIFSIVAALTVLTLALLIYSLSAIFSEHKTYHSGSFYDTLLTPTVLSDISLLCLDEANYVYSSADGVKPTINTLTCHLDTSQIDKLLADNRLHTDELLKDNLLKKRYMNEDGDFVIEIETLLPASTSKATPLESSSHEPTAPTTVVLFSY